MSVTSTLYTGLSGLDAAQTALGVVGNNIANANTTAFKASRILFTPQYYVTSQQASEPDSNYGGTNPSQEGLGVDGGTVQKDDTQGSIQSTGISSDLAISGSGYFVVQGSQQTYTRDGSFTLNDQNQLVNTAGDYVMGYGVDSNFNVEAGSLKKLSIPVGSETIAKATTTASLEGNLNSSGDVATGASELTTQPLQSSAGGAITGATPLTDLQNFGTTNNLFTAGQTLTAAPVKDSQTLPAQTLTITGATTVGDLQSFLAGASEVNTGVPPASPSTPAPGSSIINAAAGGQQLVLTGNAGSANAISLAGSALSDSNGAAPLAFTDTGNAAGESVQTAMTVYDSLGTPVTVNVTAVLASKSSAGTSWDYYVDSPDNQGGSTIVSNGTLNFDNSGNLLGSPNQSVTLNRSGTGANPQLTFNLNFSKMQALADTSSTLVSPSQDGFAIGTLDNYSIGTDGVITGTFSNGLTRTLGQVAVATFTNPEGLSDDGNNQFSPSASSGSATIGAAQKLGAGQIESGALEQSNVDLSKEFINMIQDSTGFSASSRVISTSDQLLTDLLNQVQH